MNICGELVVSEKEETASPGNQRVRSAILDFGLGLTILALLSYCLAWFLIDGFLVPFNLSFDEVGLDYSKLVAVGALFILPCAIPLVIVYRVADSVWRKIAPRLRDALPAAGPLGIMMAVHFIVAAVLLTLATLAANALDLLPIPGQDRDQLGSVLRFAILGATIAFIFSLWLAKPARDFLQNAWKPVSTIVRSEPAKPVGGAWRLFGGLGAGLLLLAAFCMTAYSVGNYYSGVVTDGRRLNVTLAGLRLPGLAAKPVRVETPDGKPLHNLPSSDCMLLLGERGETIILFDHSTASIYRLSTQTVFTVEKVESAAC